MTGSGKVRRASYRKDTEKRVGGVFDRMQTFFVSCRHQTTCETAGGGKAARRSSSLIESPLSGTWHRFRRRLLPGIWHWISSILSSPSGISPRRRIGLPVASTWRAASWWSAIMTPTGLRAVPF